MIISNIEDLSGAELKHLLDAVKQSGKPFTTKQDEAQVVIDEMNRRGKLIAKKYRKKHYPFTLDDFGLDKER